MAVKRFFAVNASKCKVAVPESPLMVSPELPGCLIKEMVEVPIFPIDRCLVPLVINVENTAKSRSEERRVGKECRL